MVDNSQQALEELFKYLRSNNVRSLADEISRVITRGTTEEIEIKGRAKELSQRPLHPDEAYKVAVEMLVASMEAIIMKDHAQKEIEKSIDVRTSIEWRKDYVEKSPIAPEEYEEITISNIEDVDKLEKDLKMLVKLLGEV